MKKVVKKASKKVAKKKVAKKKAIKKIIKKKIEPMGTKKKPIGTVSHYFSDISVGVIKLFAPLKVGDEIRIMGGESTDFNQVVKSMQVDHVEVKKAAKGKAKMLKLVLKYNKGVPAIEGARRVSKPGQRIYAKLHDIKKVRGGFGLSVISTPKGLMTGKQARKSRVGGEVLAFVW